MSTEEDIGYIKGKIEGLDDKIDTFIKAHNNGCPRVNKISASVDNLTWGFRLIIASVVGSFIWLIRK